MRMISEPKSMLHGEKHIVHIHVLVHERVKKIVPVPNYPHPLPRKSMVHPLLFYLTFVVIKKLCWWGNFWGWAGACTFQLHLAQRTSWKTGFLCTLLRIVLQWKPVKSSRFCLTLLHVCITIWFDFISLLVSSPMVLICPWLVWKHEWSILSG